MWQFRPTVPTQQPPQYIPVPSQQFLPVGGTNIGVPSVAQPVQFPQPIMQQSRPGQGGHIMPPPPLPLPIPLPDTQPNRPAISVSPQPQQNTQNPNGYMPGLAGPRMPMSSTYSVSYILNMLLIFTGLGCRVSIALTALILLFQISIPSTGQPQMNGHTTGQYQPAPQTSVPCYPAGGQPWLPGSHNIQPVAPVLQYVDQLSHSAEVPVRILLHD